MQKRNVEYHFFSGKGGVGKTSMAASAALKFARSGKKVLVISTDPAHSLGDSYDRKIGGEITKIENNLYAVEIDPQKSVEEYKEKIMPKIEGMEALKGFGLDEAMDFSSMIPGIDEIAAFDKFLRYMKSEEYDIIVFDTAPTGHALRFLSLPDILDSWVGKIIKIRMRFAGIAGMIKKILPFGDSGEDGSMGLEELEKMKKRIEEAKILLTDPERTHYNIVTIPEEMSILESERSIKILEQSRIPVKSVIVNQVTPENNHCSFCETRRMNQLEKIKKIKEKFGKYKIYQVPLFREEIRGIKKLEELYRIIS